MPDPRQGRPASRKAYSGAGDAGFTSDFSGRKLRKDDLRVVIAGKIDWLQGAVDSAILQQDRAGRRRLEAVQKKLWQAAAEISGAGGPALSAPVGEADLAACEDLLDSLGEPPAGFVRFDTPEAIALNECRLRCRELETRLVKLLRAKRLRPAVYAYVNRLSSLFFMLACRKTRKA